MNAVITGGAGFVGSHLCDAMIARGWKIICIDNLLTGAKENIEHLKKDSRFTFVQQDVCEPMNIRESADAVLHLASPASPDDYLKFPIETLRAGSMGTFNALELASAKKARFLLASTSECYGDPEVTPQPETYWGRVNSVGPRSVYDEAKRFSEALTMAYHRKHGLDTRIVRIFNTYGPRMRLNDGRALPNFLYQALSGQPLTVYGDGRQTRSFCYVTDLVDGILRLLDSTEHFPVNIGNPHEITILEFAERIRALTGSRGDLVFRPLPQDDPKRRRPEISKAKDLLKWQPKVPLEQGLQTTLKHFQKKFASGHAISR